MKEDLKPTTIFYDILFDFLSLKYIFQYGFNWNDEITKQIMNKSSQGARELSNLLSDAIYENCISTLRCLHTAEKAKKTNRLLIKNNHYRLMQNRWAEEMYACYGTYNDKAIKNKVRTCIHLPYNKCRDEVDLCTAKRVCQIQHEKEFFVGLSKGLSKRDYGDWQKQPVYGQMCEQYADVIEYNKGYKLKNNEWKFPSDELHPVFENQEEYQAFLRMIRFFADFTPLSVLGANFYRHLKEVGEEDCILIRNLPYNFELEQEYLYRALYAIVNRYTVIYEGEEYIPIRLEYRNRGMFGIKEQLVLIARSYSRQKGKGYKGEEVILNLANGLYLAPGEKVLKHNLDLGEKHLGISDTSEIVVDFYYNAKTDYLLRRRREGWKPVRTISSKPHVHKMMSPYYPEDTLWSCDREVYEVAEEDLGGFYDFINSFGDFAKLISEPQTIKPLEFPLPNKQKGGIKEYQSLLSVYNSNILRETKGILLPPRNVEIEWLEFVLDNYPEFCSIFISEPLKERLFAEVQRVSEHKGWFAEQNFNFMPRVKDLGKGLAPKYRNILEAVEKKQILHYTHKDKPVRIFPYMLEYDVTSHLSGSIREPLDIMCYSLDEKRNISILYREIRTTERSEQEDIVFDEYDKLYHLLAYSVRCAAEQKEDVFKPVAEILDKIWKRDARGNDNYTRCVKKRFFKETDYAKAFSKFEVFADSSKHDQVKKYKDVVFSYWNTSAEDWHPFQAQYQTLLLSSFQAACETLEKSTTRGALLESLNKLSSMDVWEMICGFDIDGVPNEIAFYNERMKHASVSFYLKEGYGYMIDQIYRLFGDFLCTGDPKSGKIQFTVTYEQFYYRKIHMLLMVIADKIEQITPEEIKDILTARLENKENNR